MSGPARIAVVEDESAICEVLQYNLEREGFEVTVFHRGDEAWPKLRASPPDAILLDLMLPGLDGFELARLLKREQVTAEVPLIMLTAKGEEVDRIVGLELGADDYVTKPFSPREVVLRVKAVLRRRQPPPVEATVQSEGGRWLRADPLRLDTEGHRAFVGEAEVVLTATEFRLLQILLERRGRVQTRARLLSDVWGYAEDVSSRTVDTHVRRLRRKLGAAADLLETVVGVGYRLKSA